MSLAFVFRHWTTHCYCLPCSVIELANETNCRGVRSCDSLTNHDVIVRHKLKLNYHLVAFVVVGTLSLFLSWSLQQNSPLEGYWSKTHHNNNYLSDTLEGLINEVMLDVISVNLLNASRYDSKTWQGMQQRKTTLEIHRVQRKSQSYLAFHSWKKRHR